MADIYGILKNYYGYTSFRKGQEDVINSLLSGRDTLGNYQLSAFGQGYSCRHADRCRKIPLLSDTRTLHGGHNACDFSVNIAYAGSS